MEVRNRLQFLSPENRSDPRRPIIVVCRFLSHPEALGPLAVRVRLEPFVEPKRVHHTGHEPDHKRDQDGQNFPFVHVSLFLGIAEKCTQYADNEKMTMPYKAVWLLMSCGWSAKLSTATIKPMVSPTGPDARSQNLRYRSHQDEMV